MKKPKEKQGFVPWVVSPVVPALVLLVVPAVVLFGALGWIVLLVPGWVVPSVVSVCCWLSCALLLSFGLSRRLFRRVSLGCFDGRPVGPHDANDDNVDDEELCY